MSKEECLSKLGACERQLKAVCASLRNTADWSSRDEMEADYLSDNLDRLLNKLQAVADKYPATKCVVIKPKPQSGYSSVAEPPAKLVQNGPTDDVIGDSDATDDEDVLVNTAELTRVVSGGIDALPCDKNSNYGAKRSARMGVMGRSSLQPPVLLDEDTMSDCTEDLNEAEHIDEVDSRGTVSIATKQKQKQLDTSMADFLDEDDMFEDEIMQQLEEAERSYQEHVPYMDAPAPDPSPPPPCEAEDDEDSTHQPSDPKYSEVLKKYFGYSKFRPLQWKIIDAVLNEKRDNCVIMATGYGKSLCYQFPSVFTGKSTLVISPLISLMQDQVLALSTVNVKACFMGSAQEDTATVRSNMMRGVYRVIYMTPEFVVVASPLIEELNKTVGIDLVAIDEAHCVSQWGHDFRHAYRQIGQIRTVLPKVPIMALTATATPEVRTDICRSLSLRRPLLTCTSFDRPNLYLTVLMKCGISNDIKSQMVNIGGDEYDFEGPTIVYCPTKKATQNVHDVIKGLGVSCGLYHGGLAMKVRKDTHRQFINDEIRVVVATVAFGMGIDKPDVRQIIHYGAPKDIESYYQEMGRAGRDGQDSCCAVFYNSADFATSRFMIKDTSGQFKDHKTNMLHKMEEYLAATKCRRRLILSHFESKDVTDVGGTDRCCDNCTRRKLATEQGSTSFDQPVDFCKDAKTLFMAIEGTGSRFGLTTPILMLRGSGAQRVPAACSSNALFGKGKHHTEKWWKTFARQLTNEGYLVETSVPGGFGCTVSLSGKASSWLSKSNVSDQSPFMMTPNRELQAMEKRPVVPTLLPAGPSILPSVPANTWISSRQLASTARGHASAVPTDPRDQELQKELYKQLLVLRNSISHREDLPTYYVFNNKSLLDMAKFRPVTMDTLMAIEDVAEQKAQRFGGEFLVAIKSFCAENSWAADSLPTVSSTTPGNFNLDAKLEAAFYSVSLTVQESYQQFEKDQKSLEAVATTRGVKTSTVVAHMAEAIKAGLPVDIDRLGVSERIFDLIETAIRKPPINSDISRLSPIKDQLPSYIEFNHIKVVLAVLERRYGMSESRIGDSNGATGDARWQEQWQVKPVMSSLVAKTVPPKSKPTSMSSQVGSSQGSASKRKLPGWMGSGSSEDKQPKKMKKKSSLFGKM